MSRHGTYNWQGKHMDDAAARRIQRLFRRNQVLFDTLGPMIFARRGRLKALHGTLHFSDGDDDRTARYLALADTTSPALLARFVEKGWKLARPDVIISVTGAAASLGKLVQDARLMRIFDEGIVSAATSATCWITTGGTDSGVMKLVADAMKNHNVSDVPVIGFAPFQRVHGRELLEEAASKEVTHHSAGPTAEYRESTLRGLSSADGARLNAGHTHFVLVEGAQTGVKAWGSEIELRTSFEQIFAQQLHVPMVLLVVAGGPNTLLTVLNSIRRSSPIVIISDSGGAATDIHRYCKDQSFPESYEKTHPSGQTFVEMLAEIHALQVASENRLVSFFALSDADAGENDLARTLLFAIIHNLIYSKGSSTGTKSKPPQGGAAPVATEGKDKDKLGRALQLAVKWDRVDVVQRILSVLGGDFGVAHLMALQQGLELQRVAVVRLLMSRPGFTPAGLDMVRLYGVEDAYNFLRADGALQARRHRHRHRHRHRLAHAPPARLRTRAHRRRRITSHHIRNRSSSMRGASPKAAAPAMRRLRSRGSRARVGGEELLAMTSCVQRRASLLLLSSHARPRPQQPPQQPQQPPYQS